MTVSRIENSDSKSSDKREEQALENEENSKVFDDMAARDADGVNGKKRRRPGKRREKYASVLDGISGYVYKGLKNGVVGALFTSYDRGKKDRAFGGEKKNLLSSLREAASGAFNEGYASSVSKALAEKLTQIKLKVYGAFLMTFGVYTLLFGLLDNFIMGTDRKVFGILFGLVFAVSAFPLLFSDEALASALDNSSVGAALKAVTGIRSDGSEEAGRVGKGRVSYGFIAGVVVGGIAYFLSPAKVTVFMMMLLLLWIVIPKPEFGMVALSFLIPFIPLSVSCIFISVIAVSFLVKLLRKKRFVSFETLDASVLGVLLIILLGGIVAVTPSAFGDSLVYVLLIGVYFLTVGLMKTKAWLDRMTVAAVFGLSLTCVIYFIGLVGDMTVGGVSVALADMLEGTLAAQLIGGDKAVISAVSVIALPIVFSFFMRPAFKVATGYSAMAVLFLMLPVILNGSVYSALAVCISVLLLLLIYSRNSIYIVFSCIITVPVLKLLFPVLASRTAAALAEGFSEFGKTRAQLWYGITESLSEFLFGGIGFGKENFAAVYPVLSGSTAGNAAHTYNTYLQIWVETGVFGLVIFLVFAWLIISASFTAFYRIDRAGKDSALRTKGIRINIPETLLQFANEGKREGARLSVEQYCVSRRMGIAAPLCSVVGMLFYGFFDYIWYDEKVFLLFWLAAGLCAAYCANTVNEIDDIESSYILREDRYHKFEADIF